MGPTWAGSGLSGPRIARMNRYGAHMGPTSCASWEVARPVFQSKFLLLVLASSGICVNYILKQTKT